LAHEPSPEFLQRLKAIVAQSPGLEPAAPRGEEAPAATIDPFATASLESPGTTSPPAPLPDWPVISGYEILSELGKGGMGVVYKARHLKLNRVVALKMVLAGPQATPQDLARFRTEAEAVARLQHAHIVQIYEVGELGGLPYFSLEFVAGGSLARRLQGNPQPPRAAAEMVAQLADGVQAAHSCGIIHRDLKPHNVLVTVDGTPKITDFGLAKKLDDDTGQTVSGAIMGTPSYMAPEQAAGRTKEIGPAADVYALGAILYELLVGRPPFKGASMYDTLQQVRTDEPVSPSRLQPKVPRDLETICLKCLRKEPTQRYAIASELAADLRRYLAHEPIRARPVGNTERVWRWCRRNPKLAGMTFAIAVLLVTVAVVSTVASFRLNAANEREHANRIRAEENLDVARAAVAYFTQLSEDPQLRKHGLEGLRKEMWTQARDFYGRLAQQQADDPRVEADRGRAFLQMGRMMILLGSTRDAIGAFQQAQEIFARVSGSNPGDPIHGDGLAQGLLEEGNLLQLANRLEEAQRVLDRALAVRKNLADQHPDVFAHQEGLARAYFQLGRLHQVRNQSEAARVVYEEALGRFDRLAESRRVPKSQALVAQTHMNLGTVYAKLSVTSNLQAPVNRGLAEKHYADARSLLEQMDTKDPEYQNLLAEVYHLLGRMYRDSNQPEKAIPPFEAGLSILNELTQKHEKVPEYQYRLAAMYHALGLAQVSLRQYDRAQTSYENAARVVRPLANEYDMEHYREELGTVAFDRACLDGLRARETQQDATLTPAEQAKRVDGLARDASDNLRESWAVWLKAFPAARAVLQDTDLDALRKHPDFKKLLAGFETELRESKLPAP
jgi:tetratricopeptide (TPR) repeat protein/tRNA A-37 threonylcarbamoyl transferase component Bud32